jgi:hypothetical protein
VPPGRRSEMVGLVFFLVLVLAAAAAKGVEARLAVAA